MKNQTINTKIIHKIETASGALQNALEIESASLSEHALIVDKLTTILLQLETLQGVVADCCYIEDRPTCGGCDCIVKDWDFKKGWPLCDTCKKG